MMLTDKQKEFFKEQGYLLIPQLFSKEEIDYIRKRLLEIFNSDEWKKSPYNTPNCLFDLYGYFPEFLEVVLKKEVIEIITGLLGENPVMLPEYPAHYKEYAGGWHKDATTQLRMGHQFQKDPEHLMAKFGLYLQDNNEYGGGLCIMPGSHKTEDTFAKTDYTKPRPLFRKACDKLVMAIKEKHLYKYRLLRPFIDLFIKKAEETDKRVNPHGHQIIDVPTKAGDFVIFNHLLNHRGSFPKACKINDIPKEQEKLSIFHVFGKNNNYTYNYMDFLKSRKEVFYQGMAHRQVPTHIKAWGEKMGFTPL